MEKSAFKLISIISLILFGLMIISSPTSAEISLEESFDSIIDGENLMDYDLYDISGVALTNFLEETTRIPAGVEKLETFLTIFATLMVFFIPLIILMIIGMYVYVSLVYMKLAQKLGVRHAWFAWIPLFNLYLMSRMAKMHWWPMLLILTFFIPVVNIFSITALSVFIFFWHLKICTRINCPEWWALALLTPGIGSIIFYVLWGSIIWKKEKSLNRSLPLDPNI